MGDVERPQDQKATFPIAIQNAHHLLEPDYQEQTNEILRHALKGVYDFVSSSGENKHFWDSLDQDAKLESLLTSTRPNLGDRSILAVLREFVESKSEDVEEILGIPRTNTDINMEPKKLTGRKSKRGSRPNPDAPEVLLKRGYIQLSSKEDIGMISQKIKIIHLSRQELLKLSVLEQILNLAPELEVVQVPPSFSKTHIRKGVRNLLEQRGVELRIQRDRERPYYDEVTMSDEHFERKRFFEEAMEDDDNRALFDDLKEYEFVEAEIAEIVYMSTKPISMVKASEIVGLPYSHVQRRLNRLMYHLGYKEKITDKIVINSAQVLRHKLELMKQAEQNATDREYFRNQYKVGEVAPPRTIPIGRWQMWQKVCSYLVDNTEALEDLRQRDDKTYDALVSYFQLEGIGKKRLKIEELITKHGITRSSISYLRNRILTTWGLLEED